MLLIFGTRHDKGVSVGLMVIELVIKCEECDLRYVCVCHSLPLLQPGGITNKYVKVHVVKTDRKELFGSARLAMFSGSSKDSQSSTKALGSPPHCLVVTPCWNVLIISSWKPQKVR